MCVVGVLVLVIMVKVCSFNCNSLKNSIAEVSELCCKNDILFLQETWLSKFELIMLNKIHKDFFGLGVSAFDSSSALLNGRPFGGVAVLWKRSIQSSTEVKVISERIMQIDLSTNVGVVSLLNVYLPTDYRDSESYDQFCMSLGQLACAIDILSAKTNCFGIIGDFNANSYGSAFFAELVEFCADNGLVLSDTSFLGATIAILTLLSVLLMVLLPGLIIVYAVTTYILEFKVSLFCMISVSLIICLSL